MAETTAQAPALGPDEEEAVFYHEAALNASWTGVRLALGALSFLFGAFAFAYFYLQSSTPTVSGSRLAVSRRTCGPAPRSWA